MEPWLKAKTAGLPRWAWLAMIGGAVGLGLYLRHRNAEQEEPEAEEEETGSEDSLEAYDGTESAGGLAAAGLVGPAQGQITPVEAPYIPQGFVDIFSSQGETLESAIGALAEREPGERVETVREVEPRESPATNQGVTGGGPSNRKPHHKAPKKPHRKAPKKPRQKAPKQRRPPKHRKPPKKHRRVGVGKGHPAR